MSHNENGKYLIDHQFIKTSLIYNGIGVYQIGKKLCDSDTVVLEHSHLNWFELTIANNGAGKVYTNGVSEEIKSGDIYLSFPYDIHKIESSADDPLTYSFFSFYFDKDCPYAEKFNDLALNFDVTKSRIFRNSLISMLVDMLISEMSDKNYRENRLIEITVEQLMIFIYRTYYAQKSLYSSATLNSKELLVYQKMSYISSNLLNIEKLSEISGKMGYNYSYLEKIFKQTTGKSITDYYVAKKMEIAAVLIKENTSSVSKIAETVNYSSVYTFSKAFKLYYGVSPSEYRSK